MNSMYHYVLSVFKFGDQLEATECTMKCRGLRYIIHRYFLIQCITSLAEIRSPTSDCA